MVKNYNVTIVVPMYNDLEDVRSTVYSLQEQDYDSDKIFCCFVDCGSTDGTLDYLLSLPSKNTAVFTCAGKPVGRTMPARALQMLSLQGMTGAMLVLWPGDCLYSDSLSILSREFCRANRKMYPCQVAAEVDVVGLDGTLLPRQKPLFNSARILGSLLYSGCLDYVNRGWRHQVLLFCETAGYLYGCDGVSKLDVYNTYVRHWNQLSYPARGCNILYLPQPMARCRQFSPADELDDLLNRYESLLAIMLSVEKCSNNAIIDLPASCFEVAYRKSLGKYALWRSWETRKRGDLKTAEDCAILAGIINPDLRNSEVLRRLDSLLPEKKPGLVGGFFCPRITSCLFLVPSESIFFSIEIFR